MTFPNRPKLRVLPWVLGALLASQAASAVTFELYHQENGFIGDGSELAGVLATDSAISIVEGSSAFQGNFDSSGGGEFEFDGEEFPEIAPAAVVGNVTDGASASFFTDLNFGTAGGADFVLPDGILLTSGNANPPDSNTTSGFAGFASGLGDAGLDALLEAAEFDDRTTDATVLSFDFMVTNDSNAVALDFIFASEEFPEFADEFPEIAGIFVDGTNYAAFQDGSLLSVTSAGISAGNFVDNDGNNDGGISPLAIEYDGLSVPLTAVGLLDESRTTHNIKIAVSDTGDTDLDTGIFLANLRGISLGGSDDVDGPGSSPSDPLLPVPGDDSSDGFDFQIFVGDAGIGTDPTLPIFFDPDVAIGYEFTSNLDVTSLQVTVDLGDGIYSLMVWDGAAYQSLADFMVNEIVDLTSLSFDVFQFIIAGIETSAMVDPTDPTVFVTGLTFGSAGQLSLNMNPITAFVGGGGGGGGNVPVPASIYLLALGALAMRRRLLA